MAHRAKWEAALYRLYDGQGRLLYVGISSFPTTRLEEHARTKPWWPEVAYRSIEWFETGDLAREIEKAVISSERPLHNYLDSRIPTPSAHRSEGAASEGLQEAAERFIESRRRLDADREHLNRLIFDARQAGMTRAEVVRTTGLNPQTIDAALAKMKGTP
jgi:hypothetical protein